MRNASGMPVELECYFAMTSPSSSGGTRKVSDFSMISIMAELGPLNSLHPVNT